MAKRLALIINFLAILYAVSLLLFTLCSNESDLGNVCQDMWDAAGDNLQIGQEIVIYTGPKQHPLITVTKLGKKKLQRDVFVKFKGNLPPPPPSSFV